MDLGSVQISAGHTSSRAAIDFLRSALDIRRCGGFVKSAREAVVASDR